MKEIIIEKNDAGQRLDKFLKKAFPDLPDAMLYRGIRLKRIKIDNRRAALSHRLSQGEAVQLYLNDGFLGGATSGAPVFTLAANQLSVVYEDENLLLVNKPAGILCHEDENERRDTLINRVLRYLYETGQYSPEREQSFTPALCNRIDRNTQGIVIAAKTAQALREADEIIRSRRIQKRYLCVVAGSPPREHELLRGYHTKDEKARRVQITQRPRAGAKTAITEYRRLASQNGLSLLEVILHTGRTHQIRAHLALAGCPVLGDLKYGTAKENSGPRREHQALCAYAIRFLAIDEGWALSALAGRGFCVADVDFVREYFPGQALLIKERTADDTKEQGAEKQCEK